MSRRANVVRFPRQARAWEAAKQSLLTSKWPTSALPIDADLRTYLPALRARSRYEAQNGPHVAGFLREIKINVAGPQGVTFASRVTRRNGKADKRTRQILRDGWNEWGELGSCDVTGELSWVDEQHRAVTTTARDGEALYRFVTGWEENRFRLALQAIDVETLDITMNGQMNNGNPVVMGVEMTQFRRPVRYWMRKDTPSSPYASYYASDGERIGVPADEIIHLKLPEWTWQTRGIPWASPSLMHLHRTNRYEYAAIVAAEAGASKMGFYEQHEEAEPLVGEDGQLVTGAIGTGEDADGDLVDEFEPGTIPVLPTGYRFNGWDPNFPNVDHGPFVKWMLRSVATGIGVGYNTLANDLEGVNYSSLREGNLRERDVWITLQRWFTTHFVDRVFRRWLTQALALGELPGAAFQLERYDELRRCHWQGRRWKWVDPDKDTKGSERERANLTRSTSDMIRERGDDPEDVWNEIAEDEARLAELGLKRTTAPAEPAPSKLDDDEPNEDQDDA